jgi:hypothetical protein
LLVGSALLFPASARADYVFSDVINKGDIFFNQELAINNAGTLAGYFGDGMIVFNNGYTVVPPYSRPSDFTAENFPSAMEQQTQVTGINNAGNTVGFWVDTSGANHGFTDFGGVFTSYDDPLSSASPIFTQFLGVNDADGVAGFYNNAAGNSEAFTFSSGAFTPVTPPNTTSATAIDVNNSGEVSGFDVSSINGDTCGFLDNGGTFQELLYPGSSFTQFLGLNNNSLVVGVYEDSTGTNHGFVYNTNTMTWTPI